MSKEATTEEDTVAPAPSGICSPLFKKLTKSKQISPVNNQTWGENSDYWGENVKNDGPPALPPVTIVNVQQNAPILPPAILASECEDMTHQNVFCKCQFCGHEVKQISNQDNIYFRE